MLYIIIPYKKNSTANHQPQTTNSPLCVPLRNSLTMWISNYYAKLRERPAKLRKEVPTFNFSALKALITSNSKL